MAGARLKSWVCYLIVIRQCFVPKWGGVKKRSGCRCSEEKVTRCMQMEVEDLYDDEINMLEEGKKSAN